MNYKEQLQARYESEKEHQDSFSIVEFISGSVFNFTTYDENVDLILCKKMFKVLECILHRDTFNYIDSNEDSYLNYITMVNMPFLTGRLNWGTSIRGAWFDSDEYIIVCDITVKIGEFEQFIKELFEWVIDNNLSKELL